MVEVAPRMATKKTHVTSKKDWTAYSKKVTILDVIFDMIMGWGVGDLTDQLMTTKKFQFDSD